MILSIASGKGGAGKVIVEFSLESEVAEEVEEAWRRILSMLQGLVVA